ncbi:MAG TPA: hypothetical protein VIM11_20135 [Tepidisphaeraceae bacterium]
MRARPLCGLGHQPDGLSGGDQGRIPSKGEGASATARMSRLEMKLEYHGRKHLLVALDFAGEVFASAFLTEQAANNLRRRKP